MRSVFVRRVTRCACAMGFAALVGVVFSVPSLSAQQLTPQPLRWDGEHPHPNDLTKPVGSQFALFGDADFAMIGTRGRGSMRHSFANDGPIDYYFVGSSSIVTQLSTSTGSNQVFFEGGLWAGTPPSEWNKMRAVVPELNNVTGGGWTSNWNLNAWFLRFPNMWRADDGQLGQVHSGASASSDGACTDFSNDFVNTGTPLMASSDCRETWGSEQFAGASKLIEFTSWIDYFNAVGANNFNWDWWQVPPEFVSDDLIGDWQTYGKIVDWAADNLVRFGSAMPGGSGAPEVQGYPLGLSLVYDSYTFANPDVANVTYWRAMLINESDQAYGVPIDYDSLYFGNSLGLLFTGQDTENFYRPELGGVFFTRNGVNPNCNDARAPSGVSGCGTAGFASGGAAVLVLNSPIGDLRNKLFSDPNPNNPFFAPAHPRAGDTITFNQGRICAFGGCWANTTNRSARSGFGLHAAIPADVFDGRTPADFDGLSTSTWWRTFRNYDYPVRTAQFNKWVPGGWDWNNDGVQDTLTLDSCLGEEFGAPPGGGGCAELWSDTLPGRLNNRHANFGGFIGVGPVPLAAGDTTRWTLAIVTGATRTDTETNTANAVNFYLNSYLGPESGTPPNIVSIASTPGDRGRTPGAQVQIFFDDAPEQFQDIFLQLAAAQLDPQLAADNPWLQDSLLAVASNNVAAVHVFKSCTGGNTFTADSDCDGDPAEDASGGAVDLGWQPYATFTPDDNGAFPNVFVDGAVTPGKTYLYTIVTETRGFEVNLLTRDDMGNFIPDRVTFAPRLFNVLSTSTSDANVASVYVPASRQAGGRAAEVEFTTDDPFAPAEFHPVTVLLTSDIDSDANYNAVFGDSVVVTQELDAVTGEASSATVDLYRTVTTSLDGGTTLTRLVYESANYATSNVAGVQTAGGVTTDVPNNGTITRTTVYADELTLVALNSAGAPLFVSSSLEGSNTTPGTFFGRADFPRFVLNVDNTRGGTWNSTTWFEEGPDSAVPMRGFGSPSLTWLREAAFADPTGESFNEYVIEFADFEFGPARLFEINLANREATQSQFQASLQQRRVGQTTSTSAEIAAVLGVDQEDLLAVNLPFTVRHEFPARSVTVAMLAEDKTTQVTLGRDVDAVTVEVPENQWVPGDPLIFLETINTFQRATGDAGEYIVTQAGQPVLADTLLVTWERATIGCAEVPSCNPVRAGTRGADPSSHLPVNPQTQSLRVRYLTGLTPETSYGFTVTRTLRGNQVSEVEQEDLDAIKVVPNPYIVFSAYEQNVGDRRLMFAGLPPRGQIDIYTVAGQFVQRIRWEEQDLSGNGDLFWNMRTRENTDLASGLYVFVVTGELPASGEQIRKLGKFVVIR